MNFNRDIIPNAIIFETQQFINAVLDILNSIEIII